MTPLVPPHDIAAEKSVLGSILLDPTCLPTVAPILRPADFHEASHRTIYMTMLALHEAHRAISLITVSDALSADDRLGAVGGSAALAELTEYVVTTRDVESHAALVRRKADHRAVIEMGLRLQTLGFDETIEDVLSDAQHLTHALAERVTVDDDYHMERLADAYYDAYATRRESGVPDMGIPSGLRAVDERIHGFRPGQLIVVAGRAGAGKTAYSLSLAVHAADLGKRVQYFSVEMHPIEMFTRIVARESRVDGTTVSMGVTNDHQHELITSALERARRKKICFVNAVAYTVPRIRAHALREKTLRGVDMIVVDYLGLLKPSIRTQNREQEVADMIIKLKQLAGELNVPVVCLAQLNRKVDDRNDKKPFLSDLRESGAIEQAADIVLLLSRPSYYDETEDPREFHVNVAKYRQGKTGNAIVDFDAETMHFSDHVPLEAFRLAA